MKEKKGRREEKAGLSSWGETVTKATVCRDGKRRGRSLSDSPEHSRQGWHSLRRRGQPQVIH